jgi:hypothetical protein
MALRGFGQDGKGNLVGINETLDQYTGVQSPENDVLSIIWPGQATLKAPNFPDLVLELKRRDLGMLIGGFVPGGKQQYDAPALAPFSQHLGAAKAMGHKYLGLGQSEQDIRYLWGYAKNDKMGPLMSSALGGGSSRFAAYRSFREYASAIESLSGNQLFVLARGVFTHHYLQTGLYTIAGSEQSGWPPTQVTYSFLRYCTPPTQVTSYLFLRCMRNASLSVLNSIISHRISPTCLRGFAPPPPHGPPPLSCVKGCCKTVRHSTPQQRMQFHTMGA